MSYCFCSFEKRIVLPLVMAVGLFNPFFDRATLFTVGNVAVSGGVKSAEALRQGRYLEVVEFSDFQVDAMCGDIAGEIRLGYLHDGDTVTVTDGLEIPADPSGTVSVRIPLGEQDAAGFFKLRVNLNDGGADVK